MDVMDVMDATEIFKFEAEQKYIVKGDREIRVFSFRSTRNCDSIRLFRILYTRFENFTLVQLPMRLVYYINKFLK